MAKFNAWTPEQEEEWAKWLAERPAKIQAMARKYPPNVLFRFKDTHQRVFLASYNENGTVTVSVSGEFNFVTHERNVFGVNPDDLEECDLPPVDEFVGSMNLSVAVVKKIHARRQKGEDVSLEEVAKMVAEEVG